MTCQIHKTECQYDFDADRRRLIALSTWTNSTRNPSRQYIESLEARVAILEGIVRSIRDADSNKLPNIIREIRSNNEDLEYYIPAARHDLVTGRSTNKAGYADESGGSPLVELGKIMGTLQLDDGQVHSL